VNIDRMCRALKMSMLGAASTCDQPRMAPAEPLDNPRVAGRHGKDASLVGR